MGCMSSKPADPAEKDALQQNSKIERIIKTDKKAMDRTIKILLLGMRSMFVPGRSILTPMARCWRVGQVNHYQTNAHHPRAGFPRR